MGPLVSRFGTGIFADEIRTVRDYGDGWWSCAFTNPAPGLLSPRSLT